MSPLATNQDPEIWGPDATEFVPDRWMGPNNASGGATSHYGFLTFLHGPRSCIGQTFARGEIACMLAAWVISFDTELDRPEVKIQATGGITMRPKHGLTVRVKCLLS